MFLCWRRLLDAVHARRNQEGASMSTHDLLLSIAEDQWQQNFIQKYTPSDDLKAGKHTFLFNRKRHFLFVSNLWRHVYFRSSTVVPLTLLESALQYPVK